jgi:hypothetical protein
MRIRRILLPCVFALAACSNEVTGPAPQVADGLTDPAIVPGFVCNEQLDTWVTLHGDKFSPLVTDALNSPSLAVNPTVTLTRTANVDGDAIEAFAITRENVGDDIAVRWIDGQTMQVLMTPGLELPTGIYDVQVTNANGDAATQPGVFGVLPRPTITGLTPSYICLAQGARGLVVEGTDFLVKGASLPTIEVGAKSYEPTAADGCRDLSGPFAGHQLCSHLTIELAAADFEPGLQDVSVLNIAPAACRSLAAEDSSALLVIPPPTIESIAEELACVAEGDRTFVVTGSDLVANADGQPTINVGGTDYVGTTSNCESVSVYNGTFENCTTVTFTVPQGDLMPGVHAVVVTNPDPAGCASSEPVNLTILAPPTLTEIQPEVVCSEQIDNNLILTGLGFVVYDGTNPTVTIDGQDFVSLATNCSPIDSVINAIAETCTQLDVTVPAGTLTAGELAISVTNPMPAGCTSTDAVTLAFVPPPVVTALVEDLTCVETRTDTLRVEGTGFLEISGTLPTVTFGGVVATSLSVDGCALVAGTTNVQTCSAIVVEIAMGSLPNGENNVQVENPAPAQCGSEEVVPLEVFAAPTVVDAQPVLFCTDTGDTAMTLTGTDFLTVDGVPPTVEIAGQSFAAVVDAGSCVATGRANVQSCTTITATITQGSLASGDATITVLNPEPVACPSSINGSLLVGGPPNITTTLPMAICGGAGFDGVVRLLGDTFLRIDGGEPTVLVEGVAVTADGLFNCVAVPHPTLTIESCSELELTIPLAFRSQDSAISVTNPAPADCGTASKTLVLAPTPVITAVTPLRLCDMGGSVQIDGQNFEAGLEVMLGGEMATLVTVNMDGTSAIADFGVTMEGTYDVSVRNPLSGCAVTADDQVRVVTGPRAFYIDPPVLYDGISTQVTVYLTGLFGGAVTGIQLVDSAGTVTALTNITFDAARPNTVQAVVPAGILAANTALDAFDIILTDDVNCSEQSADLVSITNELTVSVAAIDPPFGWTNSSTGVSLTSEDPTPANLSPFAATPRVYLNPDMPQAGDVATELRSVQFLSAFEVTGIVAANLPVGSYDVIVINPNGSVGLLDAAFDVTADPPPLVDTVSPGSWQTGNAAQVVAIAGENFRMPSLEVTCVDSAGAAQTAVATVVSSTATSISATVDTNGLSNLSVCEIRVTNTNDGTYADYAPITVTNPAGNFVSFSNGPNMNTARRASAVVSGAPSTRAQYIYAVGGDSGAIANGLDTVEASPLDRFGRPGSWFDMPTTLLSKRTFSGAVRVENFIYVVGGHDGAAPMSDVSRAMVLDPLDTTQISNVEFDIDPAMTGGLATGVYYYRVAPVLGATDPANPDGEMLASERQPVRVPFAGIDITMTWTAYPNAAEYRVYRSPSPDLIAGAEELIAVVPGTQTSFVDDGTAVADPLEKPLRLGALGEWHTIAQLSTPRFGHGVAVAADPVTAGLFHIYASAGDTALGRVSTVERISVTVVAPHTQTVDALGTATTALLAVSRSELSTVVGTSENASFLGGTYLYVLGGRVGTNSFTRGIDVGEVLPGGDITGFASTAAMQRNRSGYAAAVANNTIVMACGQGGSPSSSADKSTISSTLAPLLDGSSALGSAGNLRNRYLPGYTSFSGLLFIVGGDDGTNPASSTIDYSILGGTP